ncbi:MAG: 2-iminoacetate synthase ThiH [Gemmatimonadota bacterium]|nr:2-iminoacetate synthase ThiH [Gemmatimonadota bacterium]MDP6803013.1 2-iminoacetate synthase ThiH [Gemmatimonadota bacterium]MDP7032276.1 2-iminoacetate synthase ThiH [Gemmatimonadota bacterium]
MSFAEVCADIGRKDLLRASASASAADVDRALASSSPDLFDFAVLLSPAADDRLEEMARASHEITMRRFGRTVQLYAPLYVSNECVESCTYCSFARENPVVRRTLTLPEVCEEAEMLRDAGFRHVLVVSGEHPRLVSPEYMASILRELAGDFASLSVEVQPQTTEVYREWTTAGADGLIVYQETYDREVYARVHTAGKKRDYDWRLQTPERGAEAGMRRIGIGALLGLADWRVEALHLAAHAQYLLRACWRTAVTVSLPRLRPAAYSIAAPHPVSDRDMARIVCALRILLPDVGIVLSTRESASFRDGLLPLGITQMSAGSKTEPGGYSGMDTEEQFSVEDARSPAEVAQAIRARGFDPVWKDWEAVLHG